MKEFAVLVETDYDDDETTIRFTVEGAMQTARVKAMRVTGALEIKPGHRLALLPPDSGNMMDGR